MPAIAFPSDPLSYTVSPWTDGLGRQWLYTEAKNRWAEYLPEAVIPPAKVISATPPTDPTEGLEWFNSSNGRTYTRYGSAWVSDAAHLIP